MPSKSFDVSILFYVSFQTLSAAQEYEEHATESKRPLGGTYTTVKLRSGFKFCAERKNPMNNSENRLTKPLDWFPAVSLMLSIYARPGSASSSKATQIQETPGKAE